jgi:hypothetical protein
MESFRNEMRTISIYHLISRSPRVRNALSPKDIWINVRKKMWTHSGIRVVPLDLTHSVQQYRGYLIPCG